ncbi:MAG: bifunctional phosphopantothenoylcysteine decarboxylase/phosphopantothenate--cysteine ligase CoaBC [Thermoplasmata archaeon]|nr:MAG: bifunctional phosphopantothenoylcysteine decarboxylase/phosphopantothenate--cysteine ligase CoaBC [Thermoplasmata archaeon]
MHPVNDIKGEKSNKLLGKKIAVAVTGSIAAVETVKLCRELIRHGAEIYPVMTEKAVEIIHPDALEFATGRKPILRLTGEVEHVQLCGKTKNPVDLLLIAPCTANTISKIALGIDDTPVTTFATTAIGSKIPIIIVPAMHISMYENKIIKENLERCKKTGIEIIYPKIIGKKAKLPDVEEIVEHVIRIIGEKDFASRKTLVIGGSTIEPIDDVRVITNLSSGKTAISLAKSLFERGGEIKLLYGHGRTEVPGYLSAYTERFTTVDNLIKLLDKTDVKSFDLIILCAAISDFKPKEKTRGKIRSDIKKISIELVQTPKVIDFIRKKNKKATLVAFKLEPTMRNIKKGILKLIDKGADFIVANTTTSIDSDQSEIWVFNRDGKKIAHKKDYKEKIVEYILDTISI